MLKIARYGEIYIHAPSSHHYSFYNTPYIGHKTGTAVDVYSPEPLFPLEEGRVLSIRKVNPPRHISADRDFVLVIKSGELCLKVLHVEPSVKVGDKLALGELFGKLIPSGFFMPWSDLHTHYELRRCDDPYRARGAYPLQPILHRRVPIARGSKFKVVEKKKSYYWLLPLNTSEMGMTPLGTKHFWIEGGLPHYGYGGVFAESPPSFLKNLSGKRLHSNVWLFQSKFKVYANGKEVKGVGVYCNNPRFKLLGDDFEEGDIINLEFRPSLFLF